MIARAHQVRWTWTVTIVFAACLAICGATNALMIEADKAQVKTIGAMIPGAWNLWSVGDWGEYVHFTKAGKCKVRVTVYGSPVEGGWPEMGFTVDGATRETTTVTNNKAKEYAFEFEAKARDYRICVTFLNDAMTKTEDRNLYIVSMTIEPVGGVEPTVSTEEAWRRTWTVEEAKREAETVAQAKKNIETVRKSEARIRFVDEKGKALVAAKVEVELARHEFLFGGNIFGFDRFATKAENDLYKERFKAIFNFATTGFYWRWYEYVQGHPDYAYTDKVVAWCGENHIRVKGHPLLWACEAGEPMWTGGGQATTEVRKQRVFDIMRRYAGKIDFWEVLNEPSHLSGLTIDEPYRWAREADPKAQLIVNDYAVMNGGYPPFFKMLEKAKKDGGPFDGIGIQAHEPQTKRFPLAEVAAVLEHYATLGKDIYITEFTPPAAGQEITGSHIVGKWDEAAQADYGVKFYTVCFANPAVKGITWWDLYDSKGMFNEGGGLLRQDLSPKPSYEAIRKLIHEEWTTKASGTTDAKGEYTFRGFRGDYTARVTVGGKVIEKGFRVGGDGKVVEVVVGK